MTRTAILIGVVLATGATATGFSSHRASVCPTPSKVLSGVYHPSRLTVLSPCKTAKGVIAFWKREKPPGDGDLHIRLTLDPQYVSLKNAVNDQMQHGDLVVEFMPRGHLPKPQVGQHVTLVGAWVLDRQHGWKELHPVWSMRVNGHTYTSGPQNGGSPPGDKSKTSEGDCLDHGQHCKGFGPY